MILTALAIASTWHRFFVSGRDGDGPPNVTFQLAYRGAGYVVSVFEDDQPNPPRLIASKQFPDTIRWKSLTGKSNPANDYWESPNGQDHKVFPHLLLVGRGEQKGRPVSRIWDMDDERARTPRVLFAGFKIDTTYLEGSIHSEHRQSSILYEYAKSEWIGRSQWPKGARPGAWLARTVQFNSAERTFHAKKWRLKKWRGPKVK